MGMWIAEDTVTKSQQVALEQGAGGKSRTGVVEVRDPGGIDAPELACAPRRKPAIVLERLARQHVFRRRGREGAGASGGGVLRGMPPNHALSSLTFSHRAA